MKETKKLLLSAVITTIVIIAIVKFCSLFCADYQKKVIPIILALSLLVLFIGNLAKIIEPWLFLFPAAIISAMMGLSIVKYPLVCYIFIVVMFSTLRMLAEKPIELLDIVKQKIFWIYLLVLSVQGITIFFALTYLKS